MTEAECYQALGWSPGGGLDEEGLRKLILPVSGSDRTDWVLTACVACPMTGYSVPEALTGLCACGEKQIHWEDQL